ncbi:MAG: hypothetical protein JNL97_06785, partial [Verrucomicrobiales bacterium]|nr:hypothetical protein [Verrucomicrobiales bacterium]
MIFSALPLLEIALALPWIGAAAIPLFRSSPAAARFSLGFLAFLLVAVGAAAISLGAAGAVPSRVFAVDAVAVPMLPVLVLLHLLALLGTSKSRVTPALCIRILLATFVALAIVTCRDPWVLVGLLALAPVLPYTELESRGRPTRGFAIHMGLFVGLLILGQTLVGKGSASAGCALILAGLLVRGGIAPFHVWIPQLFGSASYATS